MGWILACHLPPPNIWSPAYIHGPARINGCAYHVVETCRNDEVFVQFWGTRLDAGDETGSNPDSDSPVAVERIEVWVSTD